MSALIIDDTTIENSKKLIKHAEENILSQSKLKLTIAGDIPPVGDYPDHVLLIPNGYRVVYSIEDQPRKGLCHHISISIKTKGKYPHIEAVKEIVKLFDITLTLSPSQKLWVEDINGIKAINIIEKKGKK